MSKMNELSVLMEPTGGTRSKHMHSFNRHGVSAGVKSNSVGQRPAIDSVDNTFMRPQGPSGWTELASEGQRGSQRDRCTDGVGEMVRAHSHRALKAMERGQTLFKMERKAVQGSYRGVIAF